MSLELIQVSKSYNRQIALDNITLKLDRGIIALLGSNGSGKSTLLRLLATLDQPDAGGIQWYKLSYTDNLSQLRQQIGYLPQALELPQHLTPYRLLHYLAQMRHAAPADVDEIAAKLALDAIMHKRLSQLSSGQLRLVGIAQALLGKPQLLLLDELSSGLDVIERERVYRLLSSFNKFVIFSTHILEEAESIANVIIVLHHGRILFHGTCAELKAIAETELPQSKTKKTAQQVTSIQVYYNGQTTRSHGEDNLLLHGSACTVDSAIEKAYFLLLSRME